MDVFLQENQKLKDEVFVLRTQMQKLASLKAENDQLRSLLGAEQKVTGRKLVAEIIDVAADPASHELIINRGKQQVMDFMHCIRNCRIWAHNRTFHTASTLFCVINGHIQSKQTFVFPGSFARRHKQA